MENAAILFPITTHKSAQGNSMAITVEEGKKFQRINLGTTGGDFAMSQDYLIREIRLTGIVDGDYMTFYEAHGSNPKIFRLDYSKPATFFQGGLLTKIGFVWSDCSVATPANAILSIELE
jgi:hypothetical protein